VNPLDPLSSGREDADLASQILRLAGSKGADMAGALAFMALG
jgi:hypothetical protein